MYAASGHVDDKLSIFDKDVSRLQWESCEGGEKDARRRLRFAKPVRKTVMGEKQ
jgi:hypothetical protein